MRSRCAVVLCAILPALLGCVSGDASSSSSETEIRVEPDLTENLYSFSRVVLEDVTLSRGVLDRKYPGGTLGAPCLIVEGHVRNMDPDNSTVAMFAYGYDRTGERVAQTLDADAIPGQIDLVLDYGETGSFVLHLNLAEDTESIRIFAFTHGGASP